MPDKRVLFVDNRPEFTSQPVLRLRMEGHEVDEARSREDAMQCLGEGRYDLLIFDAELPGHDGWAVLKEIREAHPDAKTKVLVFMAGQGETGKLKLVPVDAELRRPFRMDEFVGKVNALLGP